MIFDAHLHSKCKEDGGFLIGLEGLPRFEGTLTNREALALHDPEHNYFSFYYVPKQEINRTLSHPYLKFHPRREKYTPQEVTAAILRSAPRCVIIDTLNEPYWVPYDYWHILQACEQTPVVLAHAGGYLINDFIKICHFQKNAWLDFALTHTVLGKFGDPVAGLAYVNQAIGYALHSPFRHKILLSSDYPFFNQEDVFAFYRSYMELLNQNFLTLAEIIK